ncbi:MAG: TIGR03619 family F420-dependent LLM class oxidoreductase [Chloroflexota bacterium]|nr:TIGR03619 family F420-dependent LLM class oxidoreductase [Chloroflexota bacterium]
MKVAAWAEELGFSSVWVSDHVVLPDRDRIRSQYPYSPDGQWPSEADSNQWDALTVLTWVGAAAPKLMLGTAVLVLPLRNPVLVAKQAATIQLLTGGRLLLGIGAGWMREEFELIGAQFEGRGPRVDEMVQLMRALWSGKRVEFEGQSYQLRGGTMRPALEKPVPILWGGHSEATFRHVARTGDGWQPLALTIPLLEAGIKRIRQLCAEYGRDPGSVPVIASPGRAFELTVEACRRLEELGIDQVMMGSSFREPDLSDYREEMRRVAKVCGLGE